MSPILVNICHRIRPAFDKPNDEIRAASFTLFGSLYRFGEGSARDPFYEQIHNNLPSLVLHINDENATVAAVLFQIRFLQSIHSPFRFFFFFLLCKGLQSSFEVIGSTL
jgi:hypothetical protein